MGAFVQASVIIKLLSEGIFPKQARWPEKQTFQTAIIVSIRKARDIQYGYAEFTDARCIAMLDHVTIYADGRMIYSFLNGSDITVML